MTHAVTQTLLMTTLAFGVFIVLMAVGVIFSNRRIQGSCGGLNRAMGEPEQPCEFCGSTTVCPNETTATDQPGVPNP